jgi:uncharacterized membrane protein YedE/YeeE
LYKIKTKKSKEITFFKIHTTYRRLFLLFVLAIQLIIGGSLIGVGMVLAGSCPGTIFVQMFVILLTLL